MLSALAATDHATGSPNLHQDLASVGLTVIDLPDCTKLLHAVMQTAPDLVVLCKDMPVSALFASISSVTTTAPRPIVLFTMDPDAAKIEEATRAGVHAYVVNGYSANRLRSVIHLAQARFRRDQLMRDELAEMNQRFAERTLVDRANGILMGARQLREEEAFRALRRAAMDTKQRIGQVSQRVIESARYAEAINRAGQLRMLSQRLVKLQALRCAALGHPTRSADTEGLFNDSMAQIDHILDILTRSLSRPTFGDLLDAVVTPWTALRAALQRPPALAALAEMDRLAEEVLLKAEHLTANLEVAGFAAALHVINVAGRQRMLSQRFAKEALLGTLLHQPRPALDRTRAELVEGLAYLAALPLSNADIRRELSATEESWTAFQSAMASAGTAPGQTAVAELSEVLLGHFDRLTDHLERGMQALVQ